MREKSLVFEKDKEDQSKYYLSYPKPPVLDMKWENHDINVVELAKHSKVSSSAKMRLGKNGVLQLMESLTWSVSFDIFMDNCLTSFCLLTKLELTTF